MLEEYITYDQQFLNTAIGTLTMYHLMGLNKKCILLEQKKYRMILEEMITMYSNATLETNHQEIELHKLELKTVVELAKSSFISMLPKYQKAIVNYDNLFYAYDDFDFQESNLRYHVTEKGKVILNEIAISENTNEYTPGIMNHEKMHALMMTKINLKNYSAIYMELLSMLMQKITNDQVEKSLSLNTVSIIDSIIRTLDNQQHLYVLEIFQKIKLDQESTNNHFIYQYLNLKANDYLISDWYSDLLMEYYLLDSKTFKNKLDQLFKNKITIQELLDYYKISLDHKDLLPHIQKKLTEVKKYSIRP